MPGAQPGQLGVGLTGSVMGQIQQSFVNGYAGRSLVPGASTVPEGPRTITQQAFGVPSAGSGASRGLHGLILSTAALVGLAVFWWMLPR